MKDATILLLRRQNTGYEDGNYSVVAGHLDGGEPVTTAMSREAREEAGIAINPLDFRVVHVMHRLKDDGERVDFFLTAETWRGEPVIAEPNKCDDLQWFPLADLPVNVVPYVRDAIEKIMKRIPFSEFGWP